MVVEWLFRVVQASRVGEGHSCLVTLSGGSKGLVQVGEGS